MNAIATEVKWGVVFVLILLAWMAGERAVGLHSTHIDKHMIWTNLFAVPAILVYVFALRDKKNNVLAGEMTYRQGLLSGIIVTVVVVVLSPATQWVISTIIAPDYFPNVIEHSLSSGYFSTRKEAEAYFNLESYMVQSAVGALIMGVVTSAIVAIFVRSKSSV